MRSPLADYEHLGIVAPRRSRARQIADDAVSYAILGGAFILIVMVGAL